MTNNTVTVKTVGGAAGNRVVYLNGVEVRSFNLMSDDYAHTNAEEYANQLKRQLRETPEYRPATYEHNRQEAAQRFIDNRAKRMLTKIGRVQKDSQEANHEQH